MEKIDIEYFEEKFGYFDKQFNIIGDRLSSVEGKVSSVEDKVSSVGNRVGSVEKGLGSLVTKNGFDKKIATLATKYDLDVQTRELKQYVHEAFEIQQELTDIRFEELIDKMHIVDRINTHGYWIDKIAKKTGVKLGQAN